MLVCVGAHGRSHVCLPDVLVEILSSLYRAIKKPNQPAPKVTWKKQDESGEPPFALQDWVHVQRCPEHKWMTLSPRRRSLSAETSCFLRVPLSATSNVPRLRWYVVTSEEKHPFVLVPLIHPYVADCSLLQRGPGGCEIHGNRWKSNVFKNKKLNHTVSQALTNLEKCWQF